jgi:hypothetical protein
MAHSENMTFKSDYQLRWIATNKSTYPENQIKAALEEIKRREIVKNKFEDIKNIFNKLWDSIYQFFK